MVPVSWQQRSSLRRMPTASPSVFIPGSHFARAFSLPNQRRSTLLLNLDITLVLINHRIIDSYMVDIDGKSR